jgi:copper homeostasis protein
MIRPRTADFTYSDAEVAMMRSDIDAVSQIGISGVVFGANLPSGELDRDKLARLSEPAQARGLDVAIHRAFDLAPDPLAAIDICVSLGISTVLTSGGPRFAEDGIQCLKRYVDHAAGRIEIMAGSGLTANNVTRVVEGSGVNWIHASCLGSFVVEAYQPPPDRVAALGGLTLSRTDTDGRAVRQLRSVLDEMALPKLSTVGTR